MVSYIVLLATAIAGLAKASPWIALAAASVLSLAIVAEQRFVVARGHRPAPDAAFEAVQALSVFVNSSVAAAAAFALGHATAWLWLG